MQELRSSSGALVASGVSTAVGRWGAVARLQGDNDGAASASSLRVPHFHKMHDHATDAIKARYMSLRQQGRAQEFDGSMERAAMQDANVVLLQVYMPPRVAALALAGCAAVHTVQVQACAVVVGGLCARVCSSPAGAAVSGWCGRSVP